MAPFHNFNSNYIKFKRMGLFKNIIYTVYQKCLINHVVNHIQRLDLVLLFLITLDLVVLDLGRKKTI